MADVEEITEGPCRYVLVASECSPLGVAETLGMYGVIMGS